MAEVIEVQNFERRSDLGSLDSQHNNLVDYLHGPLLEHCHFAAFEHGDFLDTAPPAEQ